MLLGDYIQKLRNQRGLSQQEFADKLGIGRSTLANYEQNKRSPDYETLIEISKFFNVSIDELLGVKRKPFDVFKFILKDLSIDKETEIALHNNSIKEDARKKLLIDSGIYKYFKENSDKFYDWQIQSKESCNILIKKAQESKEIINNLDDRFINIDKDSAIKSLDEYVNDYIRGFDTDVDCFIWELEDITEEVEKRLSNVNSLEYKIKALENEFIGYDFSNKSKEEIELIYDVMKSKLNHSPESGGKQ